MTDKKTPDKESVSGGMTEAEAMQRVIDLQAKQREEGGPGAPLSETAAPSPRSETWNEYRERMWPGLTQEEEEEFVRGIGLG